MGSGRRNHVAKEGPTSQGSALAGSLSFIMEPYVQPVPFSQYVHEKASAYAEKNTHSKNSILEVANTAETDNVPSIPDLHVSPSSLAHVFPFLNPSPPTSQSKAEGKKPVSILVQPPPVPLRRPHLHRTSTGKLTAIGPSPLCQESKKSTLEKEDEKEGNRLVYTGYRIWNRRPTLWDKACAEEMEALSDLDAALERRESDYGFDVELPPDKPGSAGTSSLLFPSTNDTSDGTCSFERGSKPLSFKEHDEQSFAIRTSSQVSKQTNGLNITHNRSITSGPIFNPSLKNELKLKSDVASRPIPPHGRHLARLQFKNHMGPMWNLANKDLEEVYLHATILHESEFLDLIFCEKDEVQTWLQNHSFALTCRSQKHYYKAIDVLKNAGISPCEIKQEVLDIFEWMAEQEQADFIKGYRKLCALVKSPQGLHLTPSEMEHFSKLSLAGQYDFINEYKTRGEERETTVMRDTENFIAQFRRSYCELDKIPRKSASVDNFQTKFLQSGLDQEKDRNSAYSSSATHLPSSLFASPVMTRFDSKIDSASFQKTRRRLTTLTGDRRAPYCLLNMPMSMQPSCQDDPRACVEFDRTGQTPTSSLYVQLGSDSCLQEHYIDDCEHLALDEGATDMSKKMAQNKTYADIAKQDLKLEVIDDFPSMVPDNYFQDIDRPAASGPDEVLKCENDYKKRVECETETEMDSICSQPVLERSPRKEWFGERPCAKWAIPTPPPTEHSAEGVAIRQSPGNDSPLTSLCLEHSLSGTTANLIPVGTKSEPSDPYADGYHDVLTKNHETCILHFDSPEKRTVSCVTPPPLRGYPSIRGYSMRGSTSSYVHKKGLKDNLSEKSPRSLRKKVSTLFRSLRSRRSVGALKDVK